MSNAYLATQKLFSIDSHIRHEQGVSTSDPTSDASLIAASLSGDQQAFKQIVERYEAQVAKTVIGMLGQTDLADDIGQEVFIRFYKSMGKFRQEAQLGTYLTKIAINLSLNEIKRQKRRRIFGLISDQEQAPERQIAAPHLTENQRADQQLVQMALLQLPANFRSVIILRLLEGYSTREVSKLLEIPQGTVLSRLARAQNKLKEIIEHLEQTT